MQVFEKIQDLISQQKPFVCYVKPNETIWNLLVQQNNEIIEFFHQSGFVFVPFHEGIRLVIPFEGNEFYQGNLEKLEKKPIDSFTSETNQKEAFERLVSKGIEAIKQGEFDKVVLSRKMVLKKQISIVETFQNIISAYPTAFRYLY